MTHNISMVLAVCAKTPGENNIGASVDKANEKFTGKDILNEITLSSILLRQSLREPLMTVDLTTVRIGLWLGLGLELGLGSAVVPSTKVNLVTGWDNFYTFFSEYIL